MSGKIEISRELSESEFSAFWEQNKLDLLERKIGRSDCKAIWLEARKLAAPVFERQEPVFVKPQYLTVKGLWIECDESDPKAVAFFTSPPAPVAVVNERYEFEKYYDPDALKRDSDEYVRMAVQMAWEGWHRRACLDKVKELNQ